MSKYTREEDRAIFEAVRRESRRRMRPVFLMLFIIGMLATLFILLIPGSFVGVGAHALKLPGFLIAAPFTLMMLFAYMVNR